MQSIKNVLLIKNEKVKKKGFIRPKKYTGLKNLDMILFEFWNKQAMNEYQDFEMGDKIFQSTVLHIVRRIYMVHLDHPPPPPLFPPANKVAAAGEWQKYLKFITQKDAIFRPFNNFQAF